MTARTLVQTVSCFNADERAEQLMQAFPLAGDSGTLAGSLCGGEFRCTRAVLCALRRAPLYGVPAVEATRPDGARS